MKTFLIFLLTCIGLFLIYNGISNYNNEKNIRHILENSGEIREAYFAGGCFWCVESSFEKYNGVIDSVSGYAGGEVENPTYRQVSGGSTGHREVVKVVYDPAIISYDDLLEIFWRTVNPTDDGGQYVDRGFQYTSAIFYSSEEEKQGAEASKKALEESGRFGTTRLVTPVIAFTDFYNAENYHQNYYKKNPIRYRAYTNGSGRKQFLEGAWGDDLLYSGVSLVTERGESKIRSGKFGELTPVQYDVTQQEGTERPFDNTYWDNKAAGIYVDIIDGVPLYSSQHKYKSGTGWPSFWKPIDIENIALKEDKSLLFTRTEVEGASSGSHIGHLFDDGPADKGGLRYCMNSAAMMFIPVGELEQQGYGEYLELFQ